MIVRWSSFVFYILNHTRSQNSCEKIGYGHSSIWFRLVRVDWVVVHRRFIINYFVNMLTYFMLCSLNSLNSQTKWFFSCMSLLGFTWDVTEKSPWWIYSRVVDDDIRVESEEWSDNGDCIFNLAKNESKHSPPSKCARIWKQKSFSLHIRPI